MDSEEDINKIIEDTMEISEGNIAFIDFKESPILNLKLVERNTTINDDLFKDEIKNQLKIEYTNYAIAVNGNNTTYLATEKEAQEIIDTIKEENGEKYTNNLGIVQVYSENLEDITEVKNDEAKKAVLAEVKKAKSSSNVVKLATSQKSVTKLSSINGIKLSAKPVSGIITSRYGNRKSPGGIGSKNHKGLDIAAKLNTNIKAVSDGVVKYSGYKGALGKLIIIDHGNGVQTYYGHCNKLNVSVGDKVKAGEIIGGVGRTGTATGSHLHFEIHLNGTAVNPQKYIY